MNKQTKKTPLLLVLLIAVCMLGLMACTSTDLQNTVKVYPLKNNDVVELNPDDIIRLMKYAGYSDEMIVELGTNLHNELAQQGAADIKIGNQTESIFVVQYPYIQVSSRQRGGFVYNVITKEIR